MVVDPVRLVALRESALSVDEVLGALRDERAGAVVVFIGQVRNHDEGRGVDALDYSAHPQALAALQSVVEQVVASYDVLGAAAVHRVGALEVGDLAVIVATCAAHRGTAFEAARALIDTLKAEVPIWKNQRFDDGSGAWVGLP